MEKKRGGKKFDSKSFSGTASPSILFGHTTHTSHRSRRPLLEALGEVPKLFLHYSSLISYLILLLVWYVWFFLVGFYWNEGSDRKIDSVGVHVRV